MERTCTIGTSCCEATAGPIVAGCTSISIDISLPPYEGGVGTIQFLQVESFAFPMTLSARYRSYSWWLGRPQYSTVSAGLHDWYDSGRLLIPFALASPGAMLC